MKRAGVFGLPAALVGITILVVIASPVAGQSTSVDGGTLEIDDSSGKNILEVTGDVVLGEGQSGPNVDLEIRDPLFASSSTENSFFFDASQAVLRLGSGTAMEVGDDGDLQVYDKNGVLTINLDGDSGNATQPVSGDGFVKAWVRVHADGTVLSHLNVTGVLKDATGTYWVTFNDSALNDRPISATLDGHLSGPASGGISIGFPDDFHSGTKAVFTYDASGAAADRHFNLVVY